MFFWMMSPYLAYRWLLVAAAVLPAVFLLVKVYRADRIERESPRLIGSLIIGGIISTFFALVSERVFGGLLKALVPVTSPAYNVILYFGVVGISEELAKYMLLKKRTWNNPEFNCLYDGVVYAVALSLGFALWENISYVTMYGFSTALVRAVTAVPGHACFGVFMGVFYSLAKSNDYVGVIDAVVCYRLYTVSVKSHFQLSSFFQCLNITLAFSHLKHGKEQKGIVICVAALPEIIVIFISKAINGLQ